MADDKSDIAKLAAHGARDLISGIQSRSASLADFLRVAELIQMVGGEELSPAEMKLAQARLLRAIADQLEAEAASK